MLQGLVALRRFSASGKYPYPHVFRVSLFFFFCTGRECCYSCMTSFLRLGGTKVIIVYHVIRNYILIKLVCRLVSSSSAKRVIVVGARAMKLLRINRRRRYKQLARTCGSSPAGISRSPSSCIWKECMGAAHTGRMI